MPHFHNAWHTVSTPKTGTTDDWNTKCYCAFSMTEQGTPQNQACYQIKSHLILCLSVTLSVTSKHNVATETFLKNNFYKIIFFYSQKSTVLQKELSLRDFLKTNYILWHMFAQISNMNRQYFISERPSPYFSLLP